MKATNVRPRLERGAAEEGGPATGFPPSNFSGVAARTGPRRLPDGMRYLFCLLWCSSQLLALDLPAGWLVHAPTPAELDDLMQAGETQGWPAVTAAVQAGALQAYEQGRTDVAESWLYVARWGALFGEPETQFVGNWVKAVAAAKVDYSGMPRSFTPPAAPLSAHLSRATGRWLLGDRKFSESFFELRSSLDYLPAVFDILDQLYTADPARFQLYAQLALAIAVVYDVPPPHTWPHWQVSQTALPRRLPAPLDAFAFFVQADEKSAALQHLTRLDAGELKFLVDVVAPFPELRWAQTNVHFSLAELDKSYSAVSYRQDRWLHDESNWPDATYELARILKEGGICVDQAYFATQAGKARGVPTIYFHGVGQDGRHAWFGYLDGSQRWKLDAGRYGEQRFVTGQAQDPQTWGNLSDHELGFLADGFRRLPPYQQSRLQAAVAELYVQLGRVPEAVATARKAVGYEHRNLPAWELLLAAQAAAGTEPKVRETTLREAALAFQRYPDLNAHFTQKVADSMRARGESSAADFEERMLARKNQDQRSDLTIDEAATIMQRAMTDQTVVVQEQTFRRMVDQFGHGGGVDFYDRVVRPFVNHLLAGKDLLAAREGLAQARTALAPEPGSQLDQEMTALAAKLK